MEYRRYLCDSCGYNISGTCLQTIQYRTLQHEQDNTGHTLTKAKA